MAARGPRGHRLRCVPAAGLHRPHRAHRSHSTAPPHSGQVSGSSLTAVPRCLPVRIAPGSRPGRPPTATRPRTPRSPHCDTASTTTTSVDRPESTHTPAPRTEARSPHARPTRHHMPDTRPEVADEPIDQHAPAPTEDHPCPRGYGWAWATGGVRLVHQSRSPRGQEPIRRVSGGTPRPLAPKQGLPDIHIS